VHAPTNRGGGWVAMNTKDRLALMGRVVTVTHELERSSDGPWYRDGTRRYWKTIEVEPQAGWVAGFRTLQNGTYCGPGSDAPYLRNTESVPCILVTYWPTRNPVKVPLDGFEPGGEPCYPTSDFWDTEWGTELREALSEESKSWPRDERGRWTA
jgi:hypothetical protein